MCPMPEFLGRLHERPKVRLILPYEIPQNRTALDAVIRYVRYFADIHLAQILIHESIPVREHVESKGKLKEHGVPHVFVNRTNARYDRGGTFHLPLQELSNAVMVSQRNIALDYHDKRCEPSGVEFAQACGADQPFLLVSDKRKDSVEMASGFRVEDCYAPLSVSHFLHTLERARHMQRVTLAQLLNPMGTGRVFGRSDQSIGLVSAPFGKDAE